MIRVINPAKKARYHVYRAWIDSGDGVKQFFEVKSDSEAHARKKIKSQFYNANSEHLKGSFAIERLNAIQNPLGAVLISAMNGTKGRNRTMAKKRTAAQKAAFKKMIAARGKSNRGTKKRNGLKVYNLNGKPRKKGKRNGSLMPGSGIAAKAKYIAEGGIGAAIGVVATGATAQKVFGKYDTGWLGYALNIGLGVAGAALITKYAKRPVLAAGFLLGTAGSQVRRIYQEKIVKILPTHVGTPSGDVKPLGDVTFSPAAIRALSGVYHGSVGGDGEVGSRLGGFYHGEVGGDGDLGSRLGRGVHAMQIAG